MSHPDRKGFTLTEMVIYGLLFLLLLDAMYMLFINFNRAYQSVSGSYLLSSEFEAGMRLLRQDLKETSLLSIRAYPCPPASSGLPGVSMESARMYEDVTQFSLSSHGAPMWTKHLFYELEADKGSSTGTVYRWDNKLSPPSFVPLASDLVPTNVLDGNHKRVMLRNILLPNQEVAGVSTGGSKITTDAHGGFRISFVVQMEDGSETLADYNPAQVAAEQAPADVPVTGTTRLVQVDLQGYTVGATGRPNYYAIHFRVCPQH